MAEITVTGTVCKIERLGYTGQGNPVHEITIMTDDAEFTTHTTKANGSVNDNIMRHDPSMAGSPSRVTLTLTRSGRVADITPA